MTRVKLMNKSPPHIVSIFFMCDEIKKQGSLLIIISQMWSQRHRAKRDSLTLFVLDTCAFMDVTCANIMKKFERWRAPLDCTRM